MTDSGSHGLVNMSRIGLPSAVLALAFHMLIQHFEIIELLVWQMLAAFSALGLTIFYVNIQVFHSTAAEAGKDLAISATSFALTLAASMLIYRAFFHRLKLFPGPFAARLTRFWNVYHASKDLKYHLFLEGLHKKYGDVVRTGPRELSIARVSALPHITNCRKSIFYSQTNWKQDRLGMTETRDIEDHRRRRRPWEAALTLKQIARYDSEMQNLIGLFLDQIACERGQRINITDWVAMLAYDIMGVVGYSKDFGSLRFAKESPAITKLRHAMRALGVLFPMPWLLNTLGQIPGADGGLQPFFHYCQNLVKEKQQVVVKEKGEEPPKDIISWLIKAFEEGGPSAAPTSTALDEDSRTLVIAGADTTYGTLVNAFYYLAANPSIYAKLQADVDAACPDGETSFSHEKVKNIPFLDGIITETLRLKPPVPSGQPRLTPPEGLQIDDDLYIPGDVNVVMPQWVIQRDERYFEKPHDFIPERWIAGGEKSHMVKDMNAFFPFQVGRYYCVGKQLAYWEMRSVLARLALRYNIRFASAQDGKDFEKNILNTWTLAPPPLGMCFRERKATRA